MQSEGEPFGASMQQPELYVDADALPRDALDAIHHFGQVYHIRVVTVSSINHQISSPNHITVDASPQATDMKIVSSIRSGTRTLVVTQDYGLAALVLGKGAWALSPTGFEFTNENIDRMLLERAIHAKERKAGRHHKGPRPRTEADKQHFAQALVRLLRELTLAGSGLQSE